MAAIDTVLYDVHNTGAGAIGLTAATVATGDAQLIRNYSLTDRAWLEYVATQGSGVRQARITSPLFHDAVTGMTFSFGENPAVQLMPRETGQPVVAGDTLAVSLSAAATSDTVAALGIYYSNLPGASARLHSWGEISGIVKSIKAVQVAVTTAATIGQWSDTLITVTENVLHARTDYALLGYDTDVALLTVGIKGQETGNLRVCGPGPTTTFATSDYFINMSDLHGTPHIPVVNADNRGSIFVSAAANTASVAANVTLIFAELSQNLPN